MNKLVDYFLGEGVLGKVEHDDAGGGNRALLRCVCGHRILCEVRSEGEGIGSLVFFDDETTSENRGQRVKDCPHCSEQLELPMFFRKNRSG